MAVGVLIRWSSMYRGEQKTGDYRCGVAEQHLVWLCQPTIRSSQGICAQPAIQVRNPDGDQHHRSQTGGTEKGRNRARRWQTAIARAASLSLWWSNGFNII